MTRAEVKKLAARYPKFVEWSEADGCFVGRCPLLFAGGVHGGDEADVYRQLCRTAEEWIRILHTDGVPLPRMKRGERSSGRFVVRVDPTLHRRLALKAAAEGKSLNSLIGKALARA